MNRPFIVMGDRTSHGGTVISADMTMDICGKPMARVGDLTVCPKCKGTFAITSGADDMRDGAGRVYARHADTTACGARLLSSQVIAGWDSESAMGDPMADEKGKALAAAAESATATTSGLCLDCLLQAALTGSSTVVRD